MSAETVRTFPMHGAALPLPLAGAMIAVGVVVSSFAVMGVEAFKEGGLVESLSALAYAAAAAVIVSGMFGLSRSERSDAALASMILIVLSLRELDMHKSEWLGSLTRSATYVDPVRPLALRILAAFILLTVLGAAALFAWRQLRRIRFSWGERSGPGPHAAACFAAIALLACAKSIDGIGRKATDLGVLLGAQTVAAFAHVEESLELVAPAILCGTALSWALARGGRRSALVAPA